MFVIEEQNCISDLWCWEYEQWSCCAIVRNNKSNFLCSLVWPWYLLTYYWNFFGCVIGTKLVSWYMVVIRYFLNVNYHFGALSDELTSLWDKYYYFDYRWKKMRHTRGLVTCQQCHQANKGKAEIQTQAVCLQSWHS